MQVDHPKPTPTKGKCSSCGKVIKFRDTEKIWVKAGGIEFLVPACPDCRKPLDPVTEIPKK